MHVHHHHHPVLVHYFYYHPMLEHQFNHQPVHVLHQQHPNCHLNHDLLSSLPPVTSSNIIMKLENLSGITISIPIHYI